MSSEEDDRPKYKKAPKTAYDVQRAKLDKLMANPEKPVHMPNPKGPKDPNAAPEFVYNVMGSSAGAGSGEFHVYRQIRRKEYARQKVIDEANTKEELNAAYHAKLAENEREAEEKTSKKRAKRQKKKEKSKKRKNNPKPKKEDAKSESESELSEPEEKEEKAEDKE